MGKYGSILVGLFLTAVVVASEDPPGMAVAGTVDGPQPVLAIHIQSLSSVVKDIDRLASTLYLPPVGSNFNEFIAQEFGVGGLDGVDVNSRVIALVFMGPEFSEPIVMDEDGDLPVSGRSGSARVWSFKPDGASDGFKASLGRVYPQTTNLANGIVGYLDPERIPRPGRLYVKEQNGRIHASEHLLALEAALASEDGAGRLVSPTVVGPFRVGFNLSALLPLFETKLQETTQMMEGMGGRSANGVDPVGVLQVEADALIGIMRQMKSLSFSLSATSKAFDISYAFTPVAGSTLAQVVNGLKPVSSQYAGLMPSNALFGVCAGGSDQFDLLIEPYGDMMERMSASMGASASNMPGLIRKQMIAFKGLTLGDVAIIVAPRPNGRLGLVEVLAVKDPVKAKTLIDDQMKNYNTRFGAASPGVTVETRPGRVIAGNESLAFTYRVDARAVPSAGARPDMTMLEDGVSGEIVFVGNHMVFGMGDGAVDAVVERIEKSGPDIFQNKLVADLAPELKRLPVCLMFGQPLALIKSIFHMVSSDENAGMLDTLADSGSGMVSFLEMKDGELSGSFRLGIREINSLKFALPMLGVMMGSSSPAVPDEETERNAVETCIYNLRLIDAAKEQVAMTRQLKDGDAVSEADVVEYIKGGKMPVCPEGGEYVLHVIGANPECTILDHELP